MTGGSHRARAALGGALLALACRAAPPAAGGAEVVERAATLLDDDAVAAVLALWPRPAAPSDETNAVADDPRAARLGQALFFEASLSATGTVSCATCHDPERAFTDGRAVARGLAEGRRNTPTVLNVAHNRWFFWDGRADSAWAQAVSPLETDHEMGGDRLAIAHRLAGDAQLARAYEALFGPLPPLDDGDRFPAHARPVPGEPDHPHQRAWETMTAADRRTASTVLANVGKALAAYERRLLTRGSRFDRFVAGLAGAPGGDVDALTAAEQRGLGLFVGRGRCVTCHAGPLLTDGEFHATGAPSSAGLVDAGRWEGSAAVRADPFNAAGEHSDDRDGRRARAVRTLRRDPSSWGEFKTPSLRNVALTAPYMHAGQLPDLHAVVRFYATLDGALVFGHHGESVLTPFDLDPSEADDLVAFLRTLTDEPPPRELCVPPPSPLVDGE